MKKMVIIDDEYIVRVGIRETIDWAAYGIEILGEATNGKAGLELIHRLQPDLVISDIKMPVMDGVELVKTLHREQADLSVIILSGYKDFEFAKGALEHGASAYLLKPIDNQELIDAVVKALSALEEKRVMSKRNAVLESELPVIRKNLLQDLFSGRFDGEIADKMRLCGVQIPATGYLLVGMADDAETLVGEGTAHAVLEHLRSAFSMVLKTVDDWFADDVFSLLVIAVPGTMAPETVENLAHQALASYETTREETVSVGISARYEGCAGLHQAFAVARANAKTKPFAAINTITLPSTRGEMKPLIAKAMDYIAKNYDQNLTVKTVTDALYVSESYLLHMFKESTGKTFNEYLTDYRIISAKKMLQEGSFKVYEVAGKVGYSDEKYFSQIFKKKVGLTPSEYAARKR